MKYPKVLMPTNGTPRCLDLPDAASSSWCEACESFQGQCVGEEDRPVKVVSTGERLLVSQRYDDPSVVPVFHEMQHRKTNRERTIYVTPEGVRVLNILGTWWTARDHAACGRVYLGQKLEDANFKIVPKRTPRLSEEEKRAEHRRRALNKIRHCGLTNDEIESLGLDVAEFE